MLKNVIIKASGRYLPERVMTNQEFETILDTTDEWIVERTGIKERHYAAPGERVSDMAAMACRQCLERAGVAAEEVEVIVLGTVTPNNVFPATANWLQAELGCTNAWSFDINAGCSGFVYSLNVAYNMLRTGQHRYALVVGAEKMTALCDMTNREHCVLFGDGAGCLLLEAVDPAANPEGYGIKEFILGSDGKLGPVLHQPGGGSDHPPTFRTVAAHEHYIHMDGQVVFKNAVRRMHQCVVDVLAKVNVAPEEIDWFVAHQANERIITATQRRLGVPAEKVYINVDRYGNTTAATLPICLDELRENGRLAAGQKIVLFTFGAGLTWGSVYLEWGGGA